MEGKVPDCPEALRQMGKAFYLWGLIPLCSPGATALSLKPTTTLNSSLIFSDPAHLTAVLQSLGEPVQRE